MSLRVEKHWVCSAVAALAALCASTAFATLGEPEASVALEGQFAPGSIKESDHGSYRVHEASLPSGTVVREYVGLDGNVFAVVWRGPFMPNLKQMLGRYFDEYAAAPRSQHADRNHREVRQSDLVVQAGGHMRAYSGRAYLPQALPAGVSVEDLQ